VQALAARLQAEVASQQGRDADALAHLDDGVRGLLDVPCPTVEWRLHALAARLPDRSTADAEAARARAIPGRAHRGVAAWWPSPATGVPRAPSRDRAVGAADGRLTYALCDHGGLALTVRARGSGSRRRSAPTPMACRAGGSPSACGSGRVP
jgi:hypothetical protein